MATNNYEIKCERCGVTLSEGGVHTFDLMSLPAGKEIVKQRYGVDKTSMALVAMCKDCYNRGMRWIQDGTSS